VCLGLQNSKCAFAGSKRKVQTISRQTHAKVSHQKLLFVFFCSSKFLDEKNCKRKEVEIDKEGQESSRSFFFRNSEEI
jgi:hypothetical protein